MTDIVQSEADSSQQNIDLGVRLKFVREQNGLSQRELAKRAGVPHSSISMIEQGQSSPSINSLAKILSGLPMSLAQFFASDLVLLAQHVFYEAELKKNEMNISPGVFTQKIPLPTNRSSLNFQRVNYSANADTGETPLVDAKAISGYVVNGSLELTVNAEVSQLNAGDAFSLSPQQPHRFRNLSSVQDCIVLVCEF
jgi:transcriptional regulator with XRE-family HTH domain